MLQFLICYFRGVLNLDCIGLLSTESCTDINQYYICLAIDPACFHLFHDIYDCLCTRSPGL